MGVGDNKHEVIELEEVEGKSEIEREREKGERGREKNVCS